MPWIRKNDVLESIDSGSGKPDLFCRMTVGDRVAISINHDAAVGVIHQLQELFNNGGVDGTLAASGVRTHPHDVRILEKLLAICASDLWDKNCHVNLEIIPRIVVWGTEGNEHPLIKRLFGCGVDRLEEIIMDRKREASGEAESEVSHEHNHAMETHEEHTHEQSPGD